ncbi:hypothetical protein ACSDQ9_14225 [Aestuariimicrobium soli]|uniref:hypothetical protein n=1 Tax=Aestuariimicrobium soli TaxID=2035834 RepID=UPI003EB6AD01
MNRLIHTAIGLVALLVVGPPNGRRAPRSRAERGLSQSTENAILLAGAVAVAGIVVAVITVYVRNNLPR